MIKEIRELLDLVANSSKKEPMMDQIDRLSEKRKQFLKIISKGLTYTDQQVCEELYGVTSTSRYSKLKRRTYFNLLDIIFFSTNVNIKGSQKVSQRRARCVRQAATIRLLAFEHAPLNTLKLANIVLKEALELEMNELAIDSLTALMAYYGMTQMNSAAFKKYKQLYDELIAIKKVEDDLQVTLFGLYAEYEDKISDPTSIIFQHELKYLQNIIDSRLSFRAILYANRILCLRHEIRNNFLELERSAEYAIKSLESKGDLGRSSIMIFIRQKFIAQLKLKNSDRILETLQQMEDYVRPKSINYFVISIFKTIMYFHERDYRSAITISSELETTKIPEATPGSLKEFIKVIAGYASFVYSMDDALKTEIELKKKFNIYKLMNEVPRFQKEKRGLNISIIILHIMELLVKRKYDPIIDRVDALKQYAYRYLRKDDTFRSNCFIKMIIQMTKADFHPIRTERYTADLLTKLKSVPLELSEQPLEVEIIPYEDLWEMVMKLLERNSKIKRGRPRKQL